MRFSFATVGLIVLGFALAQAFTALAPEVSEFWQPKSPSLPSDRLTEDKIHVYPDAIVIDLKNAVWARIEDSRSMEPVLGSDSHALQIVPQREEEIRVGDIVSYVPEGAETAVIHRVIETGNDDKGWYAVMKGDNNKDADPGKVRFEQVRRVLVAIVY